LSTPSTPLGTTDRPTPREPRLGTTSTTPTCQASLDTCSGETVCRPETTAAPPSRPALAGNADERPTALSDELCLVARPPPTDESEPLAAAEPEEPSVSATATPGSANTTAPTPNAPASAPTRPTSEADRIPITAPKARCGLRPRPMCRNDDRNRGNISEDVSNLRVK
jgi:hypothetical protein